MSYQVQQVTAALIRVISESPIGPHKLEMWIGYPHDVDYDGESVVDCNKITITNAKEYRYHGIDINYAKGKSQPIKGPCPNQANGGGCFCNGDCHIEAPEALQIDKQYFLVA